MKYESMNDILNANNKIKFKLYSLEYLIVKDDSVISIYVSDYDKNIKTYNSFEELMNNYLVYREPLIEQLDRIILLDSK